MQLQKNMARWMKPYLFLAPAVLTIGFWLYRPLIDTFYFSFTKWSMVPGTSPVWVGLDNFGRFIHNKDFLTSMINTLFYIVGMLPFSVLIPLVLAVLTNHVNGWARNIYRILFFIPMIMAPVSSATIWRWLMHPANGLINHILIGLNITDSGFAFFMNEHTSKIAILIITGWKMIGFSTLMFSAALTNLNKSYFEAAELDGSSPFQRFRDMTIPLISPTIVFMIMMSILFASQWTFSYVDILTNGGPYASSTNIYYEIYKFGFANLDIGMSSAASNIFLLVFGAIAVGLTVLSRKLSFYDN